MRVGEVVLGKVMQIGNESVVVSAGLKSEAEIPLWQFKDMLGNCDINVGDEVEVEIETIEDGYGRTRLSREKACRLRAWEKIEMAFQEQAAIEGVITSRVKGGFSVSIDNVRAFLPGSLYGARVPPGDEDFEYEKAPIDFKIIKLDRARNNVVISRKAVLDKELNQEREKLMASLEVGQLIEGVVKNITDYGAFINLGGVDGLLHITDLAWHRIKHPSEVLEMGETVTVKVLKCDKERARISLGLKQLTEDPWLSVDRRYKRGDRLVGKVASLTEYGAFVELEEGIKGLVHVSEMDWVARNIHPAQICKIGDEVEVMILSIDVERHRVSLGIKQCMPNPWIEFAVNHKKGERIIGQVKSLTDFGIFVSLENGIDGLVHLNDISWHANGEDEIKNFNKGEDVEVEILTIDAERERISLGIKQIQGDPFLEFVGHSGKGAVVDGTIENMDEKGIQIQLANGVMGVIRNAEVAKNKPKEAKSALSIGQKVQSKILSIDRKNRKISLSIKALEVDEEGQAMEEYGSDNSSLALTLGQKIKEKIFSSSSE